MGRHVILAIFHVKSHFREMRGSSTMGSSEKRRGGMGGEAMRAQDIAALSAKVLLSYYDNEIRPFLEFCHEDVVWIGPAQGQIIRTREGLARAYAQEDNRLKFAVHNLSVTPLATSSPSVFEVLMTFLVDTFWPDGSTNRVDQRIILSWVNCRDAPRILVCHISNAIAYDERDRIYPVHYEKTYGEEVVPATSPRSGRICLRGVGRTTLYLDRDDVVYVESQGTHSLVHTTEGTCESVETVSAIARRYGDLFVRCHTSYLVNPAHVTLVTRCKAKLSCGAVLPIPEKRYTAIKRELTARMG